MERYIIGALVVAIAGLIWFTIHLAELISNLNDRVNINNTILSEQMRFDKNQMTINREFRRALGR